MNLASRKHMPSYLHTFAYAHKKSPTMRSAATLFLILSSAALFGCSSTPQPADTPAKPQKIAPNTSATKNPNDQIEALLEAEFTLQREGPSKAFQPFYQLVKKTRDEHLAERLMQISAASQSNINIEKSTNLLISIDPFNEQAYALKLQMLLQSHRPDEATALLSSIIDKGVSAHFLPLYIDKNIRNTDLINTVTRTLAQLPDSYHNNLSVKASDARVQFSAGDYKTTIQTTKALLANKKTTDTEPLYLLLAYSQDQLGNQKSAISTLEKGLSHFPRSTRLLTPLLEFLVHSGEIKKAVKSYQNTALTHSDHTQAGITFSNLLIATGHPKTALTTLRALPENKYGLENQVGYLIATALSDMGEKPQAIKEMKTVSGVLNTHATSQIALWLYDEHRENEINSMVLNRTHREHIPEVVTSICRLHEEKQHNDLSLALLNDALTAYPHSDALRYRKALLEDSMGNWQNTIADLKHLLDKKPQDAQYLNALGYTLLTRTKNIDEAMHYIEEAYQQDPEDPAIIDSLGWGLFLQGKLTSASFYLKKAWNTLQDAEIGAHYGEVLWQQKAHNQAAYIWEKALKESPQNSLLLETIKRLSPSLLDNTIKDNQ
jgi:tetratricopeptide (TPR) repeat protein